MILKEANNTEVVIGSQKEMAFGIDDSNPIIFEILRNKIYSNKIGAICREVSSNSRDANRERGIDKKAQIEINSTNPIFGLGNICITFRDNGYGINPDRMENIFIRYASSTKRGSNSQTGGFGLGAKTPFAYSDTFVIKTVCDYAYPIYEIEVIELIGENGEILKQNKPHIVGYKEEKRLEFVYTAIIDASGKGKMILISEKEVTNETGTEIIVPIKNSSDRALFEKECYKATMFWNEIEYIGFSSNLPFIDRVYESDEFDVIKEIPNIFEGSSSRFLGLLDGIPYPIVVDRTVENGLGNNYVILLKLDLSQVTISANREAIQNDDDTTNHISEKVEHLKDYYGGVVEEFLTNHIDFFDAYAKFLATVKNHSWNNKYEENEDIVSLINSTVSYGNTLVKGNLDVIYEGEAITGKFNFKHHNLVKVTLADYSTDDDGTIHSLKFDSKNTQTIDKNLRDTTIYYFDTGKIAYKKNYEVIKDHKVMWLLKSAKSIMTDLEKQEDLDILSKFTIPVKNYSEIVPTNIVKTKKREKKESVQLIVRTVSNLNTSIYLDYYSNDNQFSNWGSPVSNKICFHPINSISDTPSEKRWGSNIIDKIKLLKSMKKVDEVYFINKRTYAKHLAKKYRTCDDLYTELTEDLKEIREYHVLSEIIDRKIPFILFEKFSHILPKNITIVNEKFEKYKEKFQELKLNDIDWKYLNVPTPKFDYDNLVNKAINRLEMNYPLVLPYLKQFDLYNNSSYNSGKATYERMETNRKNRIINNLKNYIK
jgi:hypothetical protein